MINGDRRQLAFGNVDSPGASLGCHERERTVGCAVEHGASISSDGVFAAELVLAAAAIIAGVARAHADGAA